MSLIKLLFYILAIISKTKQFYDLKYGSLNISYYNDSECKKEKKEINYRVNPKEDKIITVLNEEDEVIDYPYDFDFFSGEIYYFDPEEDNQDEENIKGSLLCNGNCYFRRPNNSEFVIVNSNNENEDNFNNLKENYRYYSCLYKNIIESATFSITRYNDKNCNEQKDDNIFKGNEYCWDFDDRLSIRPLYFEDDNKHIFYHDYNQRGCHNTYVKYYSFNKYYFVCDERCHENYYDNKTSYRCIFKDTNFIGLKQLLLFIFVLLLF